MYPRRVAAKTEGGIDLGHPLSCQFGQDYPTLWAFLTDTEWEDGSERETGTILLCWDEGRHKAWLNDRAEGLSCWLSGATLTEVLEAAETVLRSGKGDWREQRKKRR